MSKQATRFKVNATAVTVLNSQGQSVILKQNTEHNIAEYDLATLHFLAANGKKSFNKETKKEEWIYLPSLEFLGEAPVLETPTRSVPGAEVKDSRNAGTAHEQDDVASALERTAEEERKEQERKDAEKKLADEKKALADEKKKLADERKQLEEDRKKLESEKSQGQGGK